MTLNAAVLGAGFIGKSFIRESLARGANLTVLDHKPCPAEFAGKLEWLDGEFSDEETLEQVVQNSDVVYHFISSTVPGDESDDAAELVQNVVQTLRLLKLCVKVGVKKIVFASSASVYGRQDKFPILESASTNPISSHGIHKLTIEKYLQLYKYQHGLDCKIMRLSNPYGPEQRVTGRQGFIAIVIGKILAGENIVIRGSGEDVRDFIYIDDVCDALYLMGQCETNKNIFNIGSGQGHSLNQVVGLIEKVLNKPVSVSHTESRFSDIPTSILDVTCAKQNLNYRSETSMEDGLIKTLAFHGLKICRST